MWKRENKGPLEIVFASVDEPEKNGWIVAEDFKTVFSVVNDDTILDIYI